MRKIVVAEAMHPDLLDRFKSKLDDTWRVHACTAPFDDEQMVRELADADVLISMAWPSTAPSDSPLSLIHMNGAGYDAIDFDRVPDGCTVCNVYEHEIGIAEYVVGAMLEWEIGLSRHAAALREGRWTDGFAASSPLHGELYGRTVGFVGYGRIARETARRLRAFGVRTVARTRTPAKVDEWIDDGGPMDDLRSMLACADYVVVTPPLTNATRDLVDTAFLSDMKASAVLVNVARGPIVNERALYRSLAGRQIGGAIIDTWYCYPTPGDTTPVYPSAFPFHELDNIIMTPHSSGWSRGLMERRFDFIVANLARLERGEPLLNVLKPAGERALVEP